MKFLAHPNFGLLCLRAAIGICIITHGVMTLLGGTKSMAYLGKAMAIVGITFAPVFWGGLSAWSNVICGILLILGFWTRPSSLILAGNMTMALIYHFAKGDDLSKYSQALELWVVFVALAFIGAGRFSIDKD